MEQTSFATVSTATSTVSQPIAARTKMLLEARILPTLLRLSAPNVLNLLALVGLITFDALFVGQLGPDALAGLTLVFPWMMLMQHTAASGMGGAVSSAIARALGAGRRDVADALATHALVLTVALACAFSAAMLIGGPHLYRSMGGRGEVLAAALSYSDVIFAGSLAICALNILGNVVRGTGNMSLPAKVIVGAVLGHILLSPVLIFGWGPFSPMGPAGAGWGLVISFAAGTLVLLSYLRSPRSLVTLAFNGVTLRWTLFAEMLKVGVPGTINVCINNLSVVAMTTIAAHLGTDVAIGYGMGVRLEYILIPIAFGIGTSIVAMVGTNLGAKQYDRALRIGWIGAMAVAVACGAVGVFFSVFPDLWMGLFTQKEEVVQAGSRYLNLVGPFYAFLGLGMALYFATQGLGRVLPTVAANGARCVLTACACLIAILWMEAGPSGFFVSIAGGFILYGVLTICAVRAVKIRSSVLSPALAGSHIRATSVSTTSRKRYGHVMTIALIIFVAFGCSNNESYMPTNGGSPTGHHRAALSRETAHPMSYGDLLERHQRGEPEAIRIRQDAERHRLWVLTLEHVYIYDTNRRTLLRRVTLPNWSIADFDFMCPPDMVLDGTGTAYVSNNVQPRLLQIDPTDFQTKEHHLRLISEKQWEIGFGALAFGSNGTLFALSALPGSLFKIDLAKQTAEESVLSQRVTGTCVLD